MAPVSWLLAALAALACAAAVARADIEVVWYYENAACSGQAYYGTYQPAAGGAACEQVACTAQSGDTDVYYKVTCANATDEIIPMDGSLGSFLVQRNYGTADSTCATESSEGAFYAANRCLFFDGQYVSYFCGGNNAVYETCGGTNQCGPGCVDSEVIIDQCTQRPNSDIYIRAACTSGAARPLSLWSAAAWVGGLAAALVIAIV